MVTNFDTLWSYTVRNGVQDSFPSPPLVIERLSIEQSHAKKHYSRQSKSGLMISHFSFSTHRGPGSIHVVWRSTRTFLLKQGMWRQTCNEKSKLKKRIWNHALLTFAGIVGAGVGCGVGFWNDAGDRYVMIKFILHSINSDQFFCFLTLVVGWFVGNGVGRGVGTYVGEPVGCKVK